MSDPSSEPDRRVHALLPPASASQWLPGYFTANFKAGMIENECC
jgi:hypothetical protein